MPGLGIRCLSALAVGAVAVSGCARTAEEESAAISSSTQVSTLPAPTATGSYAPFENLNVVGGQPITEGPSGLRPDAPSEVRPVTNTDGGEIDRLSALAMADIDEFWSGSYGPPLSGKYTPVVELFSWDSTDQSAKGMFCGSGTANFPNAAMCSGEYQNCTPEGSCSSSYNTIGWDRAEFIPEFQRAFGDHAVAVIMAHETGHAIQFISSDLKPRRSIVAEQQADCFSGIYTRWVTDGKSPRFTINTGEGLNSILAALLGIRDSVETDESRREGLGLGEHGSAFERISAFEMGFNDGTAACAGITDEEIGQRRGNLPVALQSGESGENPVSEESVTVLVEALNILFNPPSSPTLIFEEQSCAEAPADAPASYCPSSKTLYADVPALASLSTSISSEAGYRLSSLPQFGDYTAYSVLVSRYMLALQEQEGLSLDGEQAGLRTSCLTGVATAKMSEPVPVSGDQSIKLTAGDLDEAVAGVLVNGLLASDVTGSFAPKGFARVAAFRTGVLGDQQTCLKTFL